MCHDWEKTATTTATARKKNSNRIFLYARVYTLLFLPFCSLCRTTVEQKMTHTVRNTLNKYYIVYASTAWSTEQYTALRRWFFSSWKWVLVCSCVFFWQRWWCRVDVADDGNDDDDNNNSNNNNHKNEMLLTPPTTQTTESTTFYRSGIKYETYHMSEMSNTNIHKSIVCIAYTQAAHPPLWGKIVGKKFEMFCRTSLYSMWQFQAWFHSCTFDIHTHA